MILKATSVGELVAPLLPRSSEGRVTRVFNRSAYIEAGRELVLLLSGRLRSPMTVNLPPAQDLGGLLRVDQRGAFASDSIEVGKLTVRTKEAEVYRAGLSTRSSVSPISKSELVKGVGMLRMLYDTSESRINIVSSAGFRKVVRSVMLPLARGNGAGARGVENYLPLIGLGGGFTPAGDDLVGGFAAALNHAARLKGEPLVFFSRSDLAGRTIPESAALLDYAARGYVDEELERLILSAFGERRGSFLDNLLSVASRGHTSGIDMSLGVVLCVAALSDTEKGGGALAGCLSALRNP